MFLIEMIVGLAKTLRLNVTAEGIETAAQERWLIEAGCREGLPL
jgi:sensor c-di-GMP phosphodiesterase-like protein